jgi:hypothetical protein
MQYNAQAHWVTQDLALTTSSQLLKHADSNTDKD